MKLLSVSLKNVKTFEKVTYVNFDEKLNVLVGSNGSGKSNLLDIITVAIKNFLLLSFEEKEFRNENIITVCSPQYFLLERFNVDITKSTIELVVKVDEQDINNIRTLKDNVKTFKKTCQNNYTKYDYEVKEIINKLNQLTPGNIQLNEEFKFSITNNKLEEIQAYTSNYDVLTYLNSLELCLILAKHIDGIKLNPIYLYFSPYRSEGTIDDEVNLGSDNFYEILANYSLSTSKNSASYIKLAALHFAEKKRSYEYKISTGEMDETAWDKDDEVLRTRTILKKIGISWDLRPKNLNKNIYEIVIIKQGKEYSLTQASSGEIEIINFLLGIFAFGIKGGLIVVDEPELHLHPKWQAILLDIWINLGDLTNTQFIFSTHSASFIKDKIISNVMRVYRSNGYSSVIAVDKKNLALAKDLLHIINSYNNEKIFFADKVLLVEGKSDKLIFEKLIEHYLRGYNKSDVVEVVEVDGKLNLDKYRKFLNSFCIENYIVADRDYARTIGDESIKNLFVKNLRKIDREVLGRPDKSKDGQTLANKLQQALSSDNLENYREDLTNISEYINSRNTKIKNNLTREENQLLSNFIDEKISENIYILREGQIEDYLPDGFKNLEKIIKLVEDSCFNEFFLNADFGADLNRNREELKKIVKVILGLEEGYIFDKNNQAQKYIMPNDNSTYRQPHKAISSFLQNLSLSRLLVIVKQNWILFWIGFVILYIINRLIE